MRLLVGAALFQVVFEEFQLAAFFPVPKSPSNSVSNRDGFFSRVVSAFTDVVALEETLSFPLGLQNNPSKKAEKPEVFFEVTALFADGVAQVVPAAATVC